MAARFCGKSDDKLIQEASQITDQKWQLSKAALQEHMILHAENSGAGLVDGVSEPGASI